ncbi:MAG TPA: sigma-70 family RNA polymerase sigma factor [Caulobacteraceae bacterium]|jgi:RNA polymerase sigma-70 factor (ECF subfamily)
MDAAFTWPTAALSPPFISRAPVTMGDGHAEGPGAGGYVVSIATRGDREAFKALFLLMAPRIKAFMVRRAVDAPDEITQEVMLAVWRKAALFDPTRGTGEAWIFGIARNACIDAARRRRGAPLVDLDPMMDGEPARADAELEAAQDSRRVRAAMGGLSEEQLEVVRLSFFDDEPHSAIATRLNLPLGTVKSRLRLAMKRLRDLLEDQG